MKPSEVAFCAEGVRCGYGGLVVLEQVTVEVPVASTVALVGPNGAGKTTFADCCAGLLRSKRGQVFLGDVNLTRMSTHERVSAGLSYVPSGAGCFASLSVVDNLRIATLSGNRRAQSRSIDEILERFPRLAERRKQIAGTLSGGERQLLAIGRALIQSPQFLILDEPSSGLSPLALRDVLEAVTRVVREGGLSVLLIEQNVAMAFDVAQRAYLLNRGAIAQRIEEPNADMADDVVGSVFFGGGD